MVSVAILAVLGGLAGPSFVDTIRQYKVNAIRDELSGTIQLAKSEAIRRGGSILLSRITTDCSVTLSGSDDWSCGYELVVDTNANGTKDTGEAVVQSAAVPKGYSLTHPSLGAVVRFNTWGLTQVAVQTFRITPPDGSTSPAMTTLCMNSSGKVKKFAGQVTCS